MKPENRICGYYHTSEYHKNLNSILQKQFPDREVNIDCADHISQKHPNLHNDKIVDRTGEKKRQKQDCRCFCKKLCDDMSFCNTDRQQNTDFMDTAPDTHSKY